MDIKAGKVCYVTLKSGDHLVVHVEPFSRGSRLQYKDLKDKQWIPVVSVVAAIELEVR